MNIVKSISSSVHLLFFLTAFPTSVFAQIVPDATVGTNVTPSVINGVLIDKINGGAIRGSNLFHSFDTFNIYSGKGAYFTNPDGVNNIFTRVTGNSPSTINGVLGVLGNANLFFLNPNGIIFDANARLDLNGSFLATTASSISFSDGTFGANNLQANSVLSVNVPIGLGFGSSSGAINVNGTGHNILSNNPLLPTAPSFASGLEVKPGKTLTLVGKGINIDGGILKASGGTIKLDSIEENVNLSNQALIDTSGFSTSSIQIYGKQVNVTNGALVISQNYGLLPGGDIKISATESVNLNSIQTDFQSIIVSETLSNARSADINISTQQLNMGDGSLIGTRTFSSGASGNINITSPNSIHLIGSKNAAYTGIGSSSFVNGESGDVNISTQQLLLQNGGYIGSTNLGQGAAGNIIVNTDNIDISSNSPIGLLSNISANNYGAGKAGDVTINTRTIRLRDSGFVSTSALGIGDGGNVKVNASESVELSGQINQNSYPSNISSSVVPLNNPIRILLGLPEIPTGNAGNVTINTQNLKLTDKAIIGVANLGLGNGGTIDINANSVLLAQNSQIAATSSSGQGGNINLRASNLLLRDKSQIATTTMGSNNGGNINIHTGTIVQLQNSNIAANAVQGNGGNITINTQGLFQTPDSKITATGSKDGEIRIATPDIKQDDALKEQAANFVTTENALASNCLSQRNDMQDKFVVTGNGGLPTNPMDASIAYELLRVYSVHSSAANILVPNITAWKPGNPIIEATQLVRTPNHKLILQNVAPVVYNVAQAQLCNL